MNTQQLTAEQVHKMSQLLTDLELVYMMRRYCRLHTTHLVTITVGGIQLLVPTIEADLMLGGKHADLVIELNKLGLDVSHRTYTALQQEKPKQDC